MLFSYIKSQCLQKPRAGFDCLQYLILPTQISPFWPWVYGFHFSCLHLSPMFYILLNVCQEPKHFASWMQMSDNLFNRNKMVWGRSWALALADPSLHPWLTNTWCTDLDKWHRFSLPPFSCVHNEDKDIPLLWRSFIRLSDIWAAVWHHGPSRHWNSHSRVCLKDRSKMPTW